MSAPGPISTPFGERSTAAEVAADVDLTGKRVAIIGNGASAMQTGPEIQPKAGEQAVTKMVRFRTVGDRTQTGCVESVATDTAAIIDEIAIARVTERGATRGDDRFSEAAMEDRKKEGYF